MTAIANLPDLRPSLLLDFANSGRIDPRIQCTRASTATCFGPDGKLRTVAANIPRIDYDPATGKCLGLLVEEARTNLLLNSASFAAPAWVVNRTTLDASTVLAPNGSLAKKLSETADTGEHSISQSISPSANTVYSFSVYIKAAERKYCVFSIRNFSSQVAGANVRINLELGTYVANSLPSGVNFKIEPAGDGWWRISLGTTTVATPTMIVATILTAESESSYMHAGVAGYGIYLWGAQFEAGEFPSSYIPTEATTVTRAADSQLVDIVGLVPAGGFSLSFDASVYWGIGEYPCLLSASKTLLGEYIGPRMASGGSYINSTEGGRTNNVPGRPASGVAFRLSASFSSASASVVGRDGVVNTDSAIRSPVDLSLRRYLKLMTTASAAQGILRLSRLSIYPKLLSSAQVQRLSS